MRRSCLCVEADDEAGDADCDDCVVVADARPERVLRDARHVERHLELFRLRQLLRDWRGAAHEAVCLAERAHRCGNDKIDYSQNLRRV